MAFKTIGFIGFGLIGGSIAKKMKQNDPSVHIYATARHLETITEAYNEHLIENNSLLPLSAFRDCDHIFLCAPVQRNIEYLEELKNIIRKDCIITDVGSTKSEIHKKVSALGMEEHFIGGHPMTGSEKTGIANASSGILENAYYILTPTSKTKEDQLEEFRRFILSLGSIPLILDYEVHDYSTAAISHLPHMIAFSLVNLVKKSDDKNETMKTIAAGGFKDITRIASSSPVMWENICQSNRTQILSLLDQYLEQLEELRGYIEHTDKEALLSYFQEAKDYRDSIAVPNRHPDAIHEIYLDLADEVGGIATIAALLAKEKISIKNIGIIHNREYEEGVLRIEFYDSDAASHASDILVKHNYTIHKR